MTPGFTIPEYSTHPKHTAQKFSHRGTDWMCTIHTHHQLPHPQSLLSSGERTWQLCYVMKLHMQIWTQLQYKEISFCSFSPSWWALRTTEDLFCFPLASCPMNFAHSQPWRQLLIVFWCFFYCIDHVAAKTWICVLIFPLHSFHSIKQAHKLTPNRRMLLSHAGAPGTSVTGNLFSLYKTQLADCWDLPGFASSFLLLLPTLRI